MEGRDRKGLEKQILVDHAVVLSNPKEGSELGFLSWGKEVIGTWLAGPGAMTYENKCDSSSTGAVVLT